MINKIKIENAGTIHPVVGKILVKKLKERKHTVTRKVPKPVEEQKTINEKLANPADVMREMEDVKSREPYFIQFYEVLSVNPVETEYKAGDIIIAGFSAGMEFDLINGAKVLNKFDILGKHVA